MTLFEWLSTRWRTATAPELQPSVVPILGPKPRVPAEYLSLYTYLERRYATTAVLTFVQMEALLGFTLPAAASREKEWWTGAAVRADRHRHAWTNAWTMAGRTATPNLAARTVAFERLP